MKSFVNAEKLERKWLRKFFHKLKCSDYKLTAVGSKIVYDAECTIRNRKFLVEIKVITNTSDHHPSMLLEVKKAKNLAYEAFKQQTEILYIMAYTDGVIRVLNVTPAILNEDTSWVSVWGDRKLAYFIDYKYTKTIDIEQD